MSKSKKDIQPFWRPNFVNRSELPDIKVIRTDFIINFIAIMLALGVTFFYLQQEYRAHILKGAISDAEEEIRDASAQDAENLKLSQSFLDSAKYVVEVERFLESPFRIHEFLYDLARIKPDDLIYKSISLSESAAPKRLHSPLKYSINIAGDAKNLTVIGDFKRILGEAELLNLPGFDIQIDESLQGRNEETGVFPYTLAISLTPTKEAAPKKNDEGGAS